ncbi:MAG TPA: amidohydrolase, partial [Hellea balneolensis]|nr:amidohydrolase [Hellea balneolensis]
MRKYTTPLLLAASTLLGSIITPLASAQTVLVHGKTLVTNTNMGTIDAPTLLVKDGMIEIISTNANIPTDTSISGDGYWITPGIFAGYSRLGLVEVSAEKTTNDMSASDADQSVSLRASDGFNPKSTSVPVSRLGGVIYAAVSPGAGSDIFGGIGMVTSTTGSFNSIVKDPAFYYVELGENGADTSGGSRLAAIGHFRAALSDAKSSGGFKSPDDGDALARIDAKALKMALSGQYPLIIATDRAAEMKRLIEIKSEHPKLNINILGGAEAWMVKNDLANADIGVLIDPIENLPYSFGALGTRTDNAKQLIDAGVTTGFMSRSATGAFSQNLRLLGQHAGNAVANGVKWEDAFKAVTITPAKMYGLEKFAVIRTGSKANFVVWDGDPLEVTSAPVAIFIDGQLQSMQSRQTKLRDRYHPKRDL